MKMHLKHQQDGNLPLGKILLGVTTLIVLIAIGFYGFAAFTANKRADAIMVKANDEFRLNHPEMSLAKVNEVLKLTERVDALELKANILINQNKVYEAEDVLKRLIELKPDNPHYHYMAATMTLNEEEYSKGLPYLEAAIKAEPKNAHYPVALAIMRFKSGDEDGAKELFEAQLKKDPKYKEAWQQYAAAFANAGYHQQAASIIKRALDHFPKDSDFYFMLATSYDFLNQKQEAAKTYYRSLELEPMGDSIAAKRYFEITGKHVPLALEQMTADRIPFSSRHNVMYVQAAVNGKVGTFLVDTGASTCVIFNESAASYGVKPGSLKVEVATAGGTIQVPLTHADVQLGRNEMDNVTLGMIPRPKAMPADGIIGMNFLQNYRMEVDKSTSTIVLNH